MFSWILFIFVCIFYLKFSLDTTRHIVLKPRVKYLSSEMTTVNSLETNHQSTFVVLLLFCPNAQILVLNLMSFSAIVLLVGQRTMCLKSL